MRCPTWRAVDAETFFPQPNYSIVHKMLFPQGGVRSFRTHWSWLQVSAIIPAPLAVPCTCRHHQLIGKKNSRNMEKDLGNFLLRRKINNQWHLQGLNLIEWMVPESSRELFREQQKPPADSHITPCSTYAHKQSPHSSAAAAQVLAKVYPAFGISSPEKSKGLGHPHIALKAGHFWPPETANRS